jgi:hypothetical protein
VRRERERGRDKGVERPGGRTWESAVTAGRHGTGDESIEVELPAISPPEKGELNRPTFLRKMDVVEAEGLM